MKAKEIAQFLNLELDSKLKNLSKGNRGRAKIAATLGREADYYLLDEPFSGLDPMVRDDIIKGLIRFTDPERQTVIMSTHELKEVEPLLDEIVVLKGSRLIAHKEVDEIRDTYGKDATSWMVSLFREGGEVGMKPIVELKNLTKTIGKKKIVDNLNLALYPGQITGFLGPNGAGKTTTIRMMVGLMEPSGGDVVIEGISLADDFEGGLSKVGVIVENPEMYKYMSGYKNLVHFARMHENVTKARIDEVVSQVGMQNRIHEKVSTYSLGMRQRLGLAQALLHHPKFLILDEPTNGLDPAGIREFRTYLRSIAEKEGVSIFVSSHMLSEIELMCDRIAVIQNGKLIDIRDMAEAQESHYYIEAFPVEAAEEMLKAEGFTVEAYNGGFVINAEKTRIPGLVQQMTAQELQLFAVQPHRKTLEDQFLEMTGGGQIAEAHTK